MKKKIIQFILKIICKKVINKYQPKIIAITGSVGKTSTKDAIYNVFHEELDIRKSSGNLNSEIGAPLAFINVSNAPNGFKEWLVALLKGFLLIIKKDKKYPKLIISELGADKPGDILYLTSFIKPHIAIITAVGEVPVHIEFYKNSKSLAEEKANIFSDFKSENIAIINRDDTHYKTIKEKIAKDAKIITFGFHKESNVRIKNFSITSFKSSSVELVYKNDKYFVNLSNCLDDSFAYICASVFAVGIALEVDPKITINKMSKIKPSPGRLRPIRGKDKSLILDGSYNSAPLSMKSALSALSKIKGKRKIAVIGDMLELGDYSSQEHQKIGEIAGSFCDYIFAVGKKADIIKEFAVQQKIDKNNVFCFSESTEVVPVISSIIKPGDVILIKGSQGIRTEKIVYSLMKNKEKAPKILVRQGKSWKK